MLAHLGDHRRWSPNHPPTPSRQDLPLSALDPKNWEYGVQTLMQQMEETEAQERRPTCPGVGQGIQRAQTHWGKSCSIIAFAGRPGSFPQVSMETKKRRWSLGRWGQESCLSHKNNTGVTSFILFLLFIYLGRSCLRCVCTNGTGGHQFHSPAVLTSQPEPGLQPHSQPGAWFQPWLWPWASRA